MRAAGWMVAVVLATGCGHLKPAEVAQDFEEAIRETVADEEAVRSAALLVDAPRLGLTGAWAAGVADERDGAAFTTGTPFLSASVGKLFVSAAVLVLQERKLLSVSDPVTRWVPREVLQGLPVAGGDAAFERMTIAHLLSNRSGLPDYFDGSKTRDGAPTVVELMQREPDRRWTRAQLLAYLREHYAPAGAPGERFVYSNANFDLLGLVLEAATKQPFHEAVRTLVIAPLGLQRTWYHTLGTAPAGAPAIADGWIGNFNATRRTSLSADEAGGGLATTVGDLRTFMRGLTSGALVPLGAFQASWTQDAMHDGIDYGYALWRVRPGGLFFLLGGLPEILGVSGITGSFVYYVPAYDAVVSGTFDQTAWAEDHIAFLLRTVLPKLSRLQPVANAR